MASGISRQDAQFENTGLQRLVPDSQRRALWHSSSWVIAFNLAWVRNSAYGNARPCQPRARCFRLLLSTGRTSCSRRSRLIASPLVRSRRTWSSPPPFNGRHTSYGLNSISRPTHPRMLFTCKKSKIEQPPIRPVEVWYGFVAQAA